MVCPSMLASIPASMLNQNRPDLGIPNRIDLKTSRFRIGFTAKLVMSGLVPGIHVFLSVEGKDVDGRDEPGHDGNEYFQERKRLRQTALFDRLCLQIDA